MLKALLDGVAGVMDWFIDKLPAFSVDNTKLSDAINFLQPKFEVADKIFPVHETIAVLSVLCAFSIAMLAFWGIQRAINLLRGSG